MYRFKQVNHRIRICKSMRLLFAAIHEHNEICSMNVRNNYMQRLILLLIYIFGIADRSQLFVDLAKLLGKRSLSCGFDLHCKLFEATE